MVLPPDADTISGLVEVLRHRLGPDVVAVDRATRQAASRDYAWLSPILAEELPDSIADVVVRPRRAADVPLVLDAVSRFGVPLTVRGRGTGNYGQAVPLQRGVVLDMSACTAIRDVSDGLACVEAGVTFTQLEQRAIELGLEAPVMPSMLASTIGGFLSGGNQGVGSIENGSIWDGWVRRLEIVPCAVEAEPFTVSGTDVVPYLHSYGTAGVVVAATIRLVPRRERTVVFAAFDELADAARAGLDLMNRLEVLPRALSIDDRALAATLPAHRGVVPGTTVLRAAIAVRDIAAASALVAANGGRVTALDAAALTALYGSVYNHATLRAKRADPRVCSLQVRGWAIVEHEAEVRAALPDVRLHLDGNAPRQHGVGYSGLLLASWVDRETLDAGMARLRELGVLVISPHTYVLGGHGNVERIHEVAGIVDPGGLLNPGKLPSLAGR